MKKLFIICALFIGANTAFSQDMAAAQVRADQKTTQLVKNLALDAEQTQKVQSLIFGIEQKNEAINASAELTTDQKAERLQMNFEGEKSMMKNILTETQYAQYEKGFVNGNLEPKPVNPKAKENINTSRSSVKAQD